MGKRRVRSRCSNHSVRPGTSRSQSRSGKGFAQILSVPMLAASAWSPTHAASECASAAATTQAHSAGSRIGVSESRTVPSPVGYMVPRGQSSGHAGLEKLRKLCALGSYVLSSPLPGQSMVWPASSTSEGGPTRRIWPSAPMRACECSSKERQ